MPFEPDFPRPADERVPLELKAERVPPEQFDSEIASFDGVNLEVTAAFAKARWPSLSLEPWIYRLDGKPAAAILVMVWSVPLRLCSIAVIKRGAVLADEMNPRRRDIYAAALKHITEHYAHARRMMVSVLARAEQEPPLEAVAGLAAAGFKAGARMPFPNFYFVRLAASDDCQRKSYGQKWRYHLNKSEKQGLSFEAADRDQLPRFQALYDVMTDRKRFPDYSAYKTLPGLLETLPETLKPKFFFVTKDGEDVAGAVIFTAGRTAVYLYGATAEKALDMRAGYFMQDRIISWLRANSRAQWYDLGGTDGFLGLHQFKKGMVGQTGMIAPVPPMLNYAARRRAKLLGLAVYSFRHTSQALRRTLQSFTRDQAKPDQEPGA